MISFLNKIKIKAGFYTRFFISKYKQEKEKHYRNRLRKKLKNKNFTIISNNCWGGGVYEDLGMQYLTPTVGLFFYTPCYIKFIQNLSYYLKQPVEIINSSKYEKANIFRRNSYYPIGLLNNEIEIHFLHYTTGKEAIEKWNRRRERVNIENIFFSFTDNEEPVIEEIRAFDKLNSKKVFFSSKSIPGIHSLVWLKDFYEKKSIGDIYTYPENYRKHFNVTKWLNDI